MLLFGCAKSKETERQETKVGLYKQQLLNDEIFSKSLDNIVNNTITISKTVQSKGGQELVKQYLKLSSSNPTYNQLKQFYLENHIDTTSMLSLHIQNVANVLYFLNENKNFAEENSELQSLVLADVSKTIKGKGFSIMYKNSPISAYTNKKWTKLNNTTSGTIKRSVDPEEPPVDDPPIEEGDLSWEEVAGCAVSTLTGAISGSTGLIRNLYNVITGYNLGFSGIVKVATSAFRTFAGSNAVGMAIGLGTCVGLAALDWGDAEEPPTLDTTIQLDPAIDTINWNNHL